MVDHYKMYVTVLLLAIVAHYTSGSEVGKYFYISHLDV